MRSFIAKVAAAILLLTIVVVVQGDKCYYKSRFLFMTASEDCGSDGFCCGSCDDRYCCKDPSQAINQTECASCSAYTDIFGEVQPAVECDPSQGLYCCGSCSNRYCCKRLSRSLDQTVCWNNYVEVATTTEATTTTTVVTQTEALDPNDDNDFNYGPFMDTTQPPYDTTTDGYWYFPKPHYTYFTNPSYLWLKILIIIIPFAALVFLIIYIAVWNRQRILMRIQQQQQQQQTLNKQSRPARITRVQVPQPTTTTNVATVEAAASSTNIQDIHTMYNDDLSLVPNYDSVKNQRAPPASSRTVQGPFIYPSTEDLPNYSNLNQENK